jgi:hypothetical protein
MTAGPLSRWCAASRCLSRGSGNTDDAQAPLFQAIAGGLQKQ